MPTRAMTLLATLRPPPPLPPPRRARPALDLAARTAIALADEGARLILATAERVEIAVDTGTGHNLRLTLTPGETRIEGTLTGVVRRPDEEHGGSIEDDEDDEMEEAASAQVERLQGATGWHVTSDHLLGFDPSGPCPGCGLEGFEWQDRCSGCDAELEVDPDRVEGGVDDADRRAQRLLQGLLREGLLELSTKRGASAVEGALAAAFARGRSSPERLLDLLTERVEVAEVYADEAAIERLSR